MDFDLKEHQRKTSLLIAHYRAVFGHADYVYLASDSATSRAGSVLTHLAIGSSFLKNTPVVMVRPGVEEMCKIFKCDTQDNLRMGVEYDPKGIPVVDSWVRQQMFSLFCDLQRSRRTTVGGRGLHVMLSPDSDWNELGKLESEDVSAWINVPEEKALQLAVFRKHRDHSQIVISQDVPFLQSLRDLCRVDVKGHPAYGRLITLTLNEQGYLYDPFEACDDETKLLTRMSRRKLYALAEQEPIYMDDSALRHPQAEELLLNIKSCMVQLEKTLTVLASKQESLALADTLIARAQEVPPTVRFAWLNDDLNKTEALVDALLSDTATLPRNSRIALITERLPRAEKIQEQLAGAGVIVEIYSINKHGFLRNRDKDSPPIAGMKLGAVTTMKKKQIMEQLVKSGDVQEALSLAGDKDALKNGVITCLCEKQADTLEQLLKQADRVQSTIINWWILEYKQFSSPSFLMENPRFYELLMLALSKCNFFAKQAEKWVYRLQDLEDSPAAAKVELSFIISILKLSIERAGVTGATRIRRADIPKVLPRSERSEADLQRGKLQALVQKAKLVQRQIESLTAEHSALQRQIDELETEITAKFPKCERT